MPHVVISRFDVRPGAQFAQVGPIRGESMTIVAGNESLPKGESPIHDTVTKNIKEWTGIDNHR
ncbi:MAG TPA: hypothetical protein PLM08_24975, partial [Polyangiaceae bacterium]|nr:hypothetical protein [Polyangiaceae bacterium]